MRIVTRNERQTKRWKKKKKRFIVQHYLWQLIMQLSQSMSTLYASTCSLLLVWWYSNPAIRYCVCRYCKRFPFHRGSVIRIISRWKHFKRNGRKEKKTKKNVEKTRLSFWLAAEWINSHFMFAETHRERSSTKHHQLYVRWECNMLKNN